MRHACAVSILKRSYRPKFLRYYREAYLLNYAASKDQMRAMCRSAYDNLVAGGRFVAYTVNPAFTLSQPNSTKYRVTMLRQTPAEDRYLCDMEFVTDPPTPYQHP
jgi:toxoflavin synthase